MPLIINKENQQWCHSMYLSVFVVYVSVFKKANSVVKEEFRRSKFFFFFFYLYYDYSNTTYTYNMEEFSSNQQLHAHFLVAISLLILQVIQHLLSIFFSMVRKTVPKVKDLPLRYQLAQSYLEDRAILYHR